MSQLSELDVQNLRHLIGGSETCKAKFETYAENATDSPGLKPVFPAGSSVSKKRIKQQLMGFLN